MFQPLKIAPSILSADFMNLKRDICRIEQAGADWVHVDVMDGHFVPNITIGLPHVKQLKQTTSLPLDVHLMVSNPLDQIPWFLDAGADIISFHTESVGESADQIKRAVDIIHAGGARAALALKPHTSTSVLTPVIGELDMALVMSVEPGFSGQSYIEGSEARVAQVADMARAAGNEALLIEIDGGIGPATVARVARAGADVIVCGNAVFAQDNVAAAIAAIRETGQAC